MKTILSLVLVMMLGTMGAAKAITVDVGLGASGSDLSYSYGGVLHPDEVLAGNPNLVLNNNALVVPATSVINLYTRPTGNIFGGNYLAVFGLSNNFTTNDPGSATFTLAAGQHKLGFTWGTIDTYNTLVLTDSRNVTYTITGTDILEQLFHPVAGTSQANVIFNDPFGTIISAVFESSGNSFEVANLMDPASPVPLPASLPMFVVGCIVLFIVARTRAAKSA